MTGMLKTDRRGRSGGAERKEVVKRGKSGVRREVKRYCWEHLLARH